VNLVSLDRVTKRYAEKLPLDAVSFGIDEGERVGVIGRNGSGKSTLLRLVAGVETPDSGRVVLGNSVRVRYLPQEPDLDPVATLAEAVGGRREGEAMLSRLALPDASLRVGALSGGQRKRVALAQVLHEDTGLLILDEPTNHLDVDVVEWLEDRLRARRGALLLVTHDRYALDRLATRMVEVHRGRLATFDGSYADYLEARLLRETQAEAAERRRQNRARTELEWLRRGPRARTSKARYRVEQARTLIASGPEEPDAGLDVDLPSRRLGGKVVNLHNVGKRYGDRWVLRGVEHRLAPDARIGVVGPNGAGKTTLLRLIAGQIEPDAGKVSVGETVAVGWYGQDPVPLPPDQRVIDAVRDVTLSTKLASGVTVGPGQLLERFLFDAEAQRGVVGELSGGERRRLELLRVLATAPNLLLLDEPTNDLDLDTLGVLEDYLDAWPGALVVASHDRYLLDRVCDDVFAVEPDGAVRHHPGGWSAYRAASAAWADATPAASPPAATPADRPPPGAGRARKLAFHERRELESLTRSVPRLEARKAELTVALQSAGDDYETARRTGEELTAVLAELEAAETRWLELQMIGDT